MNGPVLRIAAQAKLNLHLRVLAREDSGYHSLETIFHRIDLADDLIIEVTNGARSISVSGADLGEPASNLAYRAAAAYSAQCGWPRGFRIELVKRIPVGAGLGGGSADAGAVLRALNSVSPRPLAPAGILALASSLGSDIPFLASESVMALAWGRGERLLSLPPLPRNDVLLLTPPFGVSTNDAYRWLDEHRRAQPRSALASADTDGVSVEGPEPSLIDALQLSTWGSIQRIARNDFEAAVAAHHPELMQYLDRLRNSRAIFAQMTGSGSTLFAILDTPPDYGKVPAEHRAKVTTTRTSIDVVQPVRVG
ncbi:MAG TPA: 4-(cytidine 5'-diphospho)-2-C-methyl-D-erythritol kinase [Gemmatimonadaceae bacterium]|nr:4-(cytidine 5'-diphospho)-2-C-methyl-D-erythritol kinase [Gemmatimonadaceae bacterium]